MGPGKSKLELAADEHAISIRELLSNNCGIKVPAGPIAGGFKAGFFFALEMLHSDEAHETYQKHEVPHPRNWADWLAEQGNTNG